MNKIKPSDQAYSNKLEGIILGEPTLARLQGRSYKAYNMVNLLKITCKTDHCVKRIYPNQQPVKA